MDATGKTEGTSCCVRVTVPHRALTAPRRVASLKSLLAPTCLTRGNGDWPLLSATAAIGTPIELSENFPRSISFGSQAQPPHTGSYVGRKVGFARLKEGRNSRKRGGTTDKSRRIFRVRISPQR